jgi:hypothetical protein
MVARSLHARKIYKRSENNLKQQFLYVVLKNTISKSGKSAGPRQIYNLSRDIIIGERYPTIKYIKLPEDGKTKIRHLRVLDELWLVMNCEKNNTWLESRLRIKMSNFRFQKL